MPAFFQKQTCCQITRDKKSLGTIVPTHKWAFLRKRKKSLAQVFRKYYFRKYFVKYFLKKIFFFFVCTAFGNTPSLYFGKLLCSVKLPGARFFKEDSLKNPN